MSLNASTPARSCSAPGSPAASIALAGAFAYAELGAIFPKAGGQYVYLRDGWHPLVGFMYGWALLLLIESGAIAAVAITFATYALRLAGRPDAAPVPLAIAAIAALSVVNYFGVKPGSRVLNVLVVLKVGALAVLIVAGALAPSSAGWWSEARASPAPRLDARRVWRRAGADPLRLRRVAERELHRRRDRQPAPQSSAEPACRHADASC